MPVFASAGVMSPLPGTNEELAVLRLNSDLAVARLVRDGDGSGACPRPQVARLNVTSPRAGRAGRRSGRGGTHSFRLSWRQTPASCAWSTGQLQRDQPSRDHLGPTAGWPRTGQWSAAWARAG